MNYLEELEKSIEKNDLEIIRKMLLHKPCDLNAFLRSGSTLLIRSIECKRMDITKLLLENGAKTVHCKDSLEKLLQRAVKWNSLPIVEYLLKSLEDDYEFDRVISKSFLGSVLMTAIYDRNLPIVQLLLKHGASPNQIYDNILPLTAAANFEDLQICINLLQHGAFLFDIKTQHGNYPNPVSLAIQAGWDKAVIFLLNLGADPDGVISWMHMVMKTNRLESGSRLLHLAAIKRDLKIIKILLEKRADVFLTDSSGNTPLHTACDDAEVPCDIIHLFIDHVKTLKNQNDQPVTDAVSESTTQAAVIYLTNFINAKNKNGRTPLMLACSKGSMQAIHILLQNKANLNSLDITKKSALNYAIENGYEEIALLLIRSGAEVKNGKAIALLRSAIGAGQDGITNVLLETGLDITQVSKQKENALHFAVKAQNLHLVKLFIKKGLSVNSRTINGETPLMLAAQTSDEQIVQTLIDGGADLDLTDEQGHTPLWAAVYSTKSDNAKILIHEGANVNMPTNICDSLYYWSLYYEDYEVFKLLLQSGAKFTLHDMCRHSGIMRDGDLCHWTVQHITSAQKLQSLCVHAIRTMIKSCFPKSGLSSKVFRLPIPERLKKYVMLTETI